MKRSSKGRDSSYFLAAQHQLRQPLNALGLLVGELRQSVSEADREAIVDDMRYALDLSNAWLDSLADLERAERGLLRFAPQDVPLQQVFTRLQDEFRPHFNHLGLGFRVVPTAAVVRADPAVLRRLLALLLDNAAKFTRDGKVLLGCRRAGGRLRIEVRDSGPGVPQDAQARVFEPFFRLENEVRPRERGLGLGLAYAQRLAELAGEALTLTSGPEGGACFALTLPRADAAAGNVAAGDRMAGDLVAGDTASGDVGLQAGAPSDATGNPLVGAAVLLVEGPDATAVKGSLETWGAVVTLVPPAALASRLASMSAGAPDLVIADRGAVEAAGAGDVLRRAAAHAAVILIVEDTAETGEGAGVHVLQRPVKAARLRALCHYVLSRPGHAAPSRLGTPQ